MTAVPTSIDDTLALLRDGGYVPDRALATVLFLSLKMGRPLFLEGEAGVGKTEIAKVLADRLGRKLIRLQCYEGLDIASAVYEWNYAAQMIEIRAAEASGDVDREHLVEDVFAERFLIRRPLLQALDPDPGGAPVLLIDELDRADEAFEAYLLEVLADNQVTIPELGTFRAAAPPIVIVTTNRTREIHDALKRRCLYHWIDYPDAERELEIVRTKVPGAGERLSREVVGFVQRLRSQELFKSPGVAETLDWATALTELDQAALDPQMVSDTLGVLLKYQDDIARIDGSRDQGAPRRGEGRAQRGRIAGTAGAASRHGCTTGRATCDRRRHRRRVPLCRAGASRSQGRCGGGRGQAVRGRPLVDAGLFACARPPGGTCSRCSIARRGGAPSPGATVSRPSCGRRG